MVTSCLELTFAITPNNAPFSTRNSTTTRSNFGALKSLAKFFRLWSFSHLYKILLTHRGEELCGVEVDTSKFGGKISKVGGKISAAIPLSAVIYRVLPDSIVCAH